MLKKKNYNNSENRRAHNITGVFRRRQQRRNNIIIIIILCYIHRVANNGTWLGRHDDGGARCSFRGMYYIP